MVNLLLLFTLVNIPTEKLNSLTIKYTSDEKITSEQSHAGIKAIINKTPPLFPVITDPPDPSFYLDTPISLKEKKGVSQAKNIYDGNGEVLGFLIPVQYHSNYT
ncbi:hypothetical protein [Halobacillus karajensis]|uniref:hypothetical protein n=1 Tax=Halobacillus karajensis TaxID=195088 RepID=UPI0005567ECE|nr:hypothetical protein [Halobacillus karajensis]